MNRLASNLLGLSLNVPAITLNVKAWILQENINLILTLFISILAMIWWVMKIYHQYWETKNLRNGDIEKIQYKYRKKQKIEEGER